jgi:hypothetical protein
MPKNFHQSNPSKLNLLHSLTMIELSINLTQGKSYKYVTNYNEWRWKLQHQNTMHAKALHKYDVSTAMKSIIQKFTIIPISVSFKPQTKQFIRERCWKLNTNEWLDTVVLLCCGQYLITSMQFYSDNIICQRV